MQDETTGLDVASLTVFIVTPLVAAWAVLLGGPNSWFAQHKNGSFGLLLTALGVGFVLNLMNADQHGKMWIKTGPLYRTKNPKLFAVHVGMSKTLTFACVAGAIFVVFFAPPFH